MLSRARTRRLAACSATCVAGVALAAAPTAAAVDIDVPPVKLPPLPADPSPVAPVAPVTPLGAPTSPGAAGDCRGADTQAGYASGATMRRALLCLVNQQRALHGRRRLGVNRRLARAAGRHAADMARRNYFGHVSPAGASPLRRARAAGWRGGVREAIAWGCATRSTPRATLWAWMASPPHRAILLRSARAAGIGFGYAPACGGRAFWVADLG